jgi:2-polyprenyl-3-methyl-5-hydroxy-6-metoxy-1,4-benzoquinol methylase
MQTFRPYICPFDHILPLVPPGSTVLDIGCGAGLLLGLLAITDRVYRGVGFDVGSQAIAEATKMAGTLDAKEKRLSFWLMDASDAWPDGLYDVVTLIDVLHHVDPDNQENVIAKAVSHVRPGGLFIYKDMAQRPRWRAAWNRLHDLIVARDWIHYVPSESVEKWGRTAGLVVEHRLRIVNCYLYDHELLVFRMPS